MDTNVQIWTTTPDGRSLNFSAKRQRIRGYVFGNVNLAGRHMIIPLQQRRVCGYETTRSLYCLDSGMNFDFSEDQKHLKSEARRFLTAHVPTAKIRDLCSGAYDAAPRKALWESFAAQGWSGIVIPEAFGGLGLEHIELCAIGEELGRALAPSPFASSVYFFAEALLLAGTDEQKSRLLPGIASGEQIGCFAVMESPGPLTGESIRAEFRDGQIEGTKLPVIDGQVATHAIVLARETSGLSLFIAELADVGREPLGMIDPSIGAATLTFANTRAERLGGPGQGLELVKSLLDRAAVLLAFEQLGGADRCLELAVDFAKERFAFGRAIGSFQAIKHKLADMYIKNELARSHAYYGAWALSTDSPDLPLAAAAARVAASDAFWYAAKETIQTYGGMGFTWDADPQLFFRRSQHLALIAGAPSEWKQRLAMAVERQHAA